MAKYFCSKCGIKLAHSRRAVPGKGHIFDLIDPHECEGYGIKSNELEEPTVIDILNTLTPIGEAKKANGVESKPSNFKIKDSRSDIKSTAPQGILNSLERYSDE